MSEEEMSLEKAEEIMNNHEMYSRKSVNEASKRIREKKAGEKSND